MAEAEKIDVSTCIKDAIEIETSDRAGGAVQIDLFKDRITNKVRLLHGSKLVAAICGLDHEREAPNALCALLTTSKASELKKEIQLIDNVRYMTTEGAARTIAICNSGLLGKAKYPELDDAAKTRTIAFRREAILRAFPIAIARVETNQARVDLLSSQPLPEGTVPCGDGGAAPGTTHENEEEELAVGQKRRYMSMVEERALVQTKLNMLLAEREQGPRDMAYTLDRATRDPVFQQSRELDMRERTLKIVALERESTLAQAQMEIDIEAKRQDAEAEAARKRQMADTKRLELESEAARLELEKQKESQRLESEAARLELEKQKEAQRLEAEAARVEQEAEAKLQMDLKRARDAANRDDARQLQADIEAEVQKLANTPLNTRASVKESTRIALHNLLMHSETDAAKRGRRIGALIRGAMSVNAQRVVYVLTNNAKTKFYAGETGDLQKRIAQHRTGNSSNAWVQQEGLFVLHETHTAPMTDSRQWEAAETRYLMMKHGMQNVRGATFVGLVLTEPVRRDIVHQCVQMEELCARCGRNNHMVISCTCTTYGPLVGGGKITGNLLHKVSQA